MTDQVVKLGHFKCQILNRLTSHILLFRIFLGKVNRSFSPVLPWSTRSISHAKHIYLQGSTHLLSTPVTDSDLVWHIAYLWLQYTELNFEFLFCFVFLNAVPSSVQIRAKN